MTHLLCSFPRATQIAKVGLYFYDENYISIGEWSLGSGKKVVLSSSIPDACRFCDLRSPSVTFRTEAHAIPECLGNQDIFTQYECDNCNQFFGHGIENDLGTWSTAQRALSGVRGKKGHAPKMKDTSRNWRFEHGADGIKIMQNESGPIAVVDETKKEITLKVWRGPHTPVAILKAFTKMALSLLPETELASFRSALRWIRQEDHQAGLVATSEWPILYTFVPGNDPLGGTVILLRRRTDGLRVPYVTFILTYGNEVFQTIVPCPERDGLIAGQSLSFPRFPNVYELDCSLARVAPITYDRLDLTARSRISGEIIQTIVRYD